MTVNIRNILWFLIFLFSCSHDKPENNSEIPHWDWIPENQNSWINDFKMTSDGNRLFLASEYPSKFYITSINDAGQTIFKTILLDTFYASGNIFINDDQIFVFTNFYGTQAETRFFVLSSNGQSLSQKPLKQIIYEQSAIQLHDGNFLALAPDTLSYDSRLVKISSTGEIIGANLIKLDIPYFSSKFYQFDSHVFLWGDSNYYKLSLSGDTLWSKRFSDEKHLHMCQINDTLFMVAQLKVSSFGKEYLQLLKMDSSGNLTYLNDIAINNTREYFHMNYNDDKTISLLGYWNYRDKILIMNMDEEGKWLFSRIYPEGLSFNTLDYAILSDGVKVFTGYTYDNPTHSVVFRLIKVDQNGNYLPFE